MPPPSHESITGSGATAIAITCDVGDEASVEAAFRKVVESFGRLDILVSNAAVFSAERDGKIDTLDQSVWDEIVRVEPHRHVSRLQAWGAHDQGDGQEQARWSARARRRACSG